MLSVWSRFLNSRRLLLREIFTAARGTHEVFDEYDRVMAEEHRIAVPVEPERVYGSS